MNRSPDDLDDLTLPQRPRRMDSRGDLRSEQRTSSREDLRDNLASQDREFTLSTGTVLALFFGLALVCAVFFGFGYSMGRKSAVAAGVPSADATSTADASAADTTAASKPPAGSPAIQAIPGYLSQGQADAANRNASASTPTVRTSGGNATSVTVPLDGSVAPKLKKPPTDPDAQIVEAPKPALTRPTLTATTAVPAANSAATTPSSVPVTSTSATGGTTYVQIAAVSHKEDADVLLSALKRRGYSVFTRQSENDPLIHVQVGPFANKKDAEAMRQKLLGDGYNAILK